MQKQGFFNQVGTHELYFKSAILPSTFSDREIRLCTRLGWSLKPFMQKISAIWLIIIYLTGTQGWRIEQHFCGGEPVSTQILTKVSWNDLAPDDDQDTSEDCCHNHVFQCKSDNGIGSQIFYNFSPVWLATRSNLTDSGYPIFFSTITELFKILAGKDPPWQNKKGNFLVFGCFRI